MLTEPGGLLSEVCALKKEAEWVLQIVVKHVPIIPQPVELRIYQDCRVDKFKPHSLDAKTAEKFFKLKRCS